MLTFTLRETTPCFPPLWRPAERHPLSERNQQDTLVFILALNLAQCAHLQRTHQHSYQLLHINCGSFQWITSTTLKHTVDCVETQGFSPSWPHSSQLQFILRDLLHQEGGGNEAYRYYAITSGLSGQRGGAKRCLTCKTVNGCGKMQQYQHSLWLCGAEGSVKSKGVV